MSGADELDEAIALANDSPAAEGPHPGAGRGPAPRPRGGAGSGSAAGSSRNTSGAGTPDGDGSCGRSGGEDGSAGRCGGGGQDAHAHDLPWPEARTYATRVAGPLDAHTLPLSRALHHTLDVPLDALTDLPSFDTSAMDGWAVAGPGPWEPAEDPAGTGILAGDRREPRTLPDGQAVRIATGARVPPGTSAVLRSEYGEVRGRRLLATRPPQTGADIRPRGQECRSGDRLLPAGTPVTPAVLGLAAAAGYDSLAVVRRPRAEVLVLGDELLHHGVPHEGRIRDALGPMVEPWLTDLGADVLVTRRLGDDAEALHEAVATTRADLVITTGGTAHGPVDHLRSTLDRVGARLLIEGVRVRPGHPMLLARLPAGRGGAGGATGGAGRPAGRDVPGGPYLVGLPGNPLAALSGLVTLAAPLIRTLAGHAPEHLPSASLTDGVHGHPRDTRLVPVDHDPAEARARPLHYNGPAMLRGVSTASALAVVPPGEAGSGTRIRVLPLPWFTW